VTGNCAEAVASHDAALAIDPANKGGQGNAHQVVPGGRKAEQLDIQHVGKPCDRMPVRHRGGTQCPFDAVRGQSLLDDGVARDVARIVVADELVSGGTREHGQRDQHEEKSAPSGLAHLSLPSAQPPRQTTPATGRDRGSLAEIGASHVQRRNLGRIVAWGAATAGARILEVGFATGE